MKKQVAFWIANLISVFHVSIGTFFLIGWAFPELQFIYFLLMTLWIGSWVSLGYCPLSRWEFLLRKQYDPSIDPETEIIQFYLKKTLNRSVPSEKIMRVGLCVFAILIMLSLFFSLSYS